MDESWLLYEAARCSPSGRVAEIGSHKGRSTIALALGLDARGGGWVLAVDPFDAVIDGESGDARLKRFEENLLQARVADRVTLHRRPSHEMARVLASNSIDVLFVDGSHEYEDVLQDIDDWTPKLVNGGLMLFNDPVIPEVGWALRDRVARRGSPLRGAGLIRNTLLTCYRPHTPWRMADDVRRLRLRAALPLMWRIVQLVERLGAGNRFARTAAVVCYAMGWTVIRTLLPRARIEPI